MEIMKAFNNVDAITDFIQKSLADGSTGPDLTAARINALADYIFSLINSNTHYRKPSSRDAASNRLIVALIRFTNLVELAKEKTGTTNFVLGDLAEALSKDGVGILNDFISKRKKSS